MTQALPPQRSSPGSDKIAPLTVTRVAPPRSGHRLAAATWLAAAFVVVAIVKPWGGGGPVTPTFRPYVTAPVEITPAPTEDRSATGLAVPVCLGSGVWQVPSIETWRQRDVRVWRAIEPVTATGPLDVGIPSVRVVADHLAGLGWCAPAFGPQQPVGPARVRAWLVADGRPTPVPLQQVQPEGGITPIAALYLPASGPWVSGLVVFEYTDTGTGWSGWFAAELEILEPSSTAAPTPLVAAPS